MQKRVMIWGPILILVVIGVLVAATTFSNSHAPDERASLRFSNTQTWDDRLAKLLPERLPHTTRNRTEQYLASINLPSYPENTSPQTDAELSELHTLAATERAQAIAEIEAEVYTENLRFGDFVYGTNDKPLTTELLATAREHLLPVVLRLKQHFDRVRPSYLDPSLTTAIGIPNHPAYPSGHATESYLMALLLSELDPTTTDRYLADAVRIARNREIAGVHYASDSSAGRLLAQQFYELFVSGVEGQQLLDAAREEWE